MHQLYWYCESGFFFFFRIAVFCGSFQFRYDAHQVLEQKCGFICVYPGNVFMGHVSHWIWASWAFSYQMLFMWVKHSSTVLRPFVPSDKRETGAKLKFTESVGVGFTVALLLQNHCEWQLHWSAFGHNDVFVWIKVCESVKALHSSA